MNIPETILTQLGGSRFVAMTGCYNFVGNDNVLLMTIPKNHSKANKLRITLNSDDTYTMEFFKFTAGRLSRKTWQFTEDKVEEVKTYEGIYFDQLQELFTEVTWMYTRL